MSLLDFLRKNRNEAPEDKPEVDAGIMEEFTRDNPAAEAGADGPEDDVSAGADPEVPDADADPFAAFLDPLDEETKPEAAEAVTRVIPVERKLRESAMSPAGLYPHEILLLEYAHTIYTDGGEVEAFWKNRYGVENVHDWAADLVNREFLTEGALETALNRSTAARLKQELKDHGLKISGNKNVLTARLLEGVPREELEASFPRRTYDLTEAGAKALAESPHIAYIHRHAVDGLDIWSLHDLVVHNPDTPYRDLIWDHMERQSKQYAEAENFLAYRNLRYRMYQFLMEEDKVKRAFSLLTEVIYYDLSGTVNGGDPLYRYISEKYFFPYETSIVKIQTGILKAVADLCGRLNLKNAEMLRALLVQFFNQYTVPYHLFTSEECADIVLYELIGDRDKLHEIYAAADRRFGEIR